MPCSACFSRRLPSNTNGFVTTPMVSAPMLRARSAMIGAPPVPVPPPMPAVTKTMSAPSSAARILSRSSSAAWRPISGFAPAPRPLVTCAPSWICVPARLLCRAWQSVFAAMKSTPVRPARIIVLSALPPPPPTPTTLIFAPRSPVSSSMIPPVGRWALSVGRQEPNADRQTPNAERLSKQLLHPRQKALPDRSGVGRERPHALRALLHPEVQEAHRGGVLRALHHVGEPAASARQAPAHGEAQHFFRQLRHAVQVRRAAGEHHAARQQIFLSGFLDFSLHQLEQFLDARLDDLAEDAPVQN